MIRTIDGRKYLMRDTRPVSELREMYRKYCEKFGQTDFREWLNRGRIYIEIKAKK